MDAAAAQKQKALEAYTKVARLGLNKNAPLPSR
jgi:hypothetical protein